MPDMGSSETIWRSRKVHFPSMPMPKKQITGLTDFVKAVTTDLPDMVRQGGYNVFAEAQTNVKSEFS